MRRMRRVRAVDGRVALLAAMDDVRALRAFANVQAGEQLPLWSRRVARLIPRVYARCCERLYRFSAQPSGE